MSGFLAALGVLILVVFTVVLFAGVYIIGAFMGKIFRLMQKGYKE